MSNPLHKQVRYVTKVGDRVVSLPNEPGPWTLDLTDPASTWQPDASPITVTASDAEPPGEAWLVQDSAIVGAITGIEQPDAENVT